MQPASNLLKSDPQLDALKVPPQSLEAEQSVLGGLMLDEMAGPVPNPLPPMLH